METIEEVLSKLLSVDKKLLCFGSSDKLLKVNIGCSLDETVTDVYYISWNNPNRYHYMKDIVDVKSSGYWYGGPELAQQKWPLAINSSTFAPYVSGDVLKTDGGAISGMGRYWLCSNKCAIYVSDLTPLWTEHWDGRLSLQAQIRDSPYTSFHENCDEPILNYAILKMTDGASLSLKDFHMRVHNLINKKRAPSPDIRTVEQPIWTTWARYKTEISQDVVLKFVEEIKENHADISQLELDDRWASKYGDFNFDVNKFPDVSFLCKELQKKNIRLTLWVHPFINLDSTNGTDDSVLDLCVKDSEGKAAPTKWWNGDAYVVDFTNPKASEWFSRKLHSLQELGIYSFKFDGGEVTYLPTGFHLYKGDSPGDFVKSYVEMAASFGNAVEARVFSKCQWLPMYFRTQDRLSTWDNAGLSSVLPVALNFSLLGYYYNMPDIIGGNAYSEGKCSKELYIRWMQLNTLLITMQFSIPPWDFDQETCEVYHMLMDTRRKLMNYLKDAIENAFVLGVPVICPMWWLSEAEGALSCGDQFVVNNDLIVAPVVTEGVSERSVFLPEGCWKHGLTNDEYEGPVTVKVNAPLISSVPYFIRKQ